MSGATLDGVRANRGARKYAPREQAARIAWGVGSLAFRAIPRPFFGTRAALLRLFGASIGSQVHVDPSARITMPWNVAIGDGAAIGADVRLYALGPVTIGAGATVSQGAHLCAGTHDYTRRDMPLVKPPITIGAHAWVCADAFIGPGVTVGEGSVIGARAVVMRSLGPGVVAAGNPARVVRPRRCPA